MLLEVKSSKIEGMKTTKEKTSKYYCLKLIGFTPIKTIPADYSSYHVVLWKLVGEKQFEYLLVIFNGPMLLVNDTRNVYYSHTARCRIETNDAQRLKNLLEQFFPTQQWQWQS